MKSNSILDLVNKDRKLLVLLTGILVDSVLLVSLMVYIGIRFVF